MVISSTLDAFGYLPCWTDFCPLQIDFSRSSDWGNSTENYAIGHYDPAALVWNPTTLHTVTGGEASKDSMVLRSIATLMIMKAMQ